MWNKTDNNKESSISAKRRNKCNATVKEPAEQRNVHSLQDTATLACIENVLHDYLLD